MIQDLFVPVLTPFTAGDTVDHDALAAHCSWVCSQGARGVMLFGTTGEGPSVSVEEKLQVAGRLLGTMPDLQVIGSVTENSVVDVRRCIDGYNDLAVQATLVLPPTYFREAATDGLREFFAQVVPTSTHPVLAYHIPSLAPAVPVDVVAQTGLWGAKDSSGDITYTEAVLATGRGVMVGAESTIPDAMRQGAAGTIAGMGNVLPGLLAEICSRSRAGDLQGAYALRDAVGRVQAALHAVAPGMEWVAAMKQLVRHLSGTDLGAVRLPLRSRRDYLTAEMRDVLAAAAESYAVTG